MSEINANRLERDELEMYARRALQSWRNSDWLARYRPQQWDDLADFPNEVWLDLGGGAGESQQEPGAIVVGTAMPWELERTGEHRGPDINWSITNGVPAADATVDRIIIPEGTLRGKPPATQDFIMREVARSLRVGGTLVFREDAALLSALRDTLGGLGFQLDTVSRRADRDNEHTYSLMKKTIDPLSLGQPIFRETVLGETRPPSIREPTT